MDEKRYLHMKAFIASRADGFGRLVIEEGLYDQYSMEESHGEFWLVNFSPREYCEYGRTAITHDDAWSYLRRAGMPEQ